MHAEALATVRRLLNRWHEKYDADPAHHVVEFGARNVNGSPRDLLKPGGLPVPAALRWIRTWIGFDAISADGVDFLALNHRAPFVAPNYVARTDLVVSTEALEHDPHWRETLLAARVLLRRGGALILTWASPKRPEHGRYDDTPTPGHYAGISPEAVAEHLRSLGFESVEVGLDRDDLDAWAFAISPGYVEWQSAGGSEECKHGVARSVRCRDCDLATLAALPG